MFLSDLLRMFEPFDLPNDLRMIFDLWTVSIVGYVSVLSTIPDLLAIVDRWSLIPHLFRVLRRCDSSRVRGRVAVLVESRCQPVMLFHYAMYFVMTRQFKTLFYAKATRKAIFISYESVCWMNRQRLQTHYAKGTESFSGITKPILLLYLPSPQGWFHRIDDCAELRRTVVLETKSYWFALIFAYFGVYLVHS